MNHCAFAIEHFRNEENDEMTADGVQWKLLPLLALSLLLSGCAGMRVTTAFPKGWNSTHIGMSPDWKPVLSISGDLNGDHRRDYVMVLSSSGATSEQLPPKESPGKLIVLLSEPHGRGFRVADSSAQLLNWSGRDWDCVHACPPVLRITQGRLQVTQIRSLEVGPFMESFTGWFQYAPDGHLRLVQAQYELRNQGSLDTQEVIWDNRLKQRTVRRYVSGEQRDTVACQKMETFTPVEMTLSEMTPSILTDKNLPNCGKPMFGQRGFIEFE